MTSRIAKSSQKLALQALGQYGVIPNASGVGTPAGVPDPTMYGVMAPAYADALKSQNDAIRGPLSDIVLRGGAEDERAAYSQALKDSYLGSIGIANNATRGKIEESLATGRSDDAKNGMTGAYGVIDGLNGPELQNDPVAAMVNNAYHRNDQQSGIVKNFAAAAKDARDAGIETAPSTFADQTTPANQTDRTAGYGVIQNLTPVEQTDRDYKQSEAESHRISAGADATRAAKYTGSDGGSVTISTTTQDANGNPVVTTHRTKGETAPVVEAPANLLQSRIDANKAAGGTSQQHGSYTTLIAPDGSRRKFNLAGQPIQ